MSFKLRKIIIEALTIMCVLLFLWSGYTICMYAIDSKRSETAYNAAQNMVQVQNTTAAQPQGTLPSEDDNSQEIIVSDTQPVDEYAELKIAIDVDWESLKSKSKDALAWLYIPDTNINYPIVQRDNSYYLNHDYVGNRSSSGAIFLDYKQTLQSQNMIIYGHHMKSDTMFHRLPYYTEQDYFDEHKYVYIVTETGTEVYEILSVEYVDRLDNAYTREFETIADKINYINEAIDNSLVLSNCEIDYSSKLLLLSTCTGRIKTERVVLHAILLTKY